MADTKISDLGAASALAGTEVLPVVQSSATKKATVAQMVAAVTTVGFAAGTAAAPAITWTGDTNTGIYSDAADTIRFSTGGTLRMSIGATGIIGQVFTSGLATGTSAAGYSNSGTDVTAVGPSAGYTNSGNSSVMVGTNAGYGNSGLQATLVGVQAGQSNTGAGLMAFGYQAGLNNTGANSTMIGTQAGGAGNTYNGVILLGCQPNATGANQFVVGSASVPAHYWIPGHDPNTYLDIATADTWKVYAGGTKQIEASATGLGFFNTAAVAKPTGVAVSAAGIHAALVTLGLIAA